MGWKTMAVEQLGWKPKSGENWMTVRQLLYHMAGACDAMFGGLITGEWTCETSLGVMGTVA